MSLKIEEIIENFQLIDDWEERYRYLIELGQALPELPESDRTSENKVLGCASQVWLLHHWQQDGDKKTLKLQGDSDAHIVRGLVAVMIALYSNKTPAEVLEIDPIQILSEIGLEQHLTPQRSNGLRSMVERIQNNARAAIE
ncbi:SufE family protein [Microvirga sp. W0021]|uniref:SufE family protein n=1 Tax=Hohaiivirga grylli TaxID=3133970 RepID=A0ABV0BHI3_9HYPH